MGVVSQSAKVRVCAVRTARRVSISPCGGWLGGGSGTEAIVTCPGGGTALSGLLYGIKERRTRGASTNYACTLPTASVDSRKSSACVFILRFFLFSFSLSSKRFSVILCTRYDLRSISSTLER